MTEIELSEREADRLSDPVFVMCMGRSGSTLLRFLLDAHPDLACPPELKFPAALSQLAGVWTSICGLPSGQADPARGTPEAVLAGIRATAGAMIGPLLDRVGKVRYCDKNLGTHLYADLLAEAFPGAKFISLFRHPMDMIASGIEACPWGLSNYGFEPYVAAAPGNSVLALARYWTDHSASILAAEQRLAARCHRVRYEDLVSDPESVAAAIFGFLGVRQMPGISATCFSRDRERSGGADFKIWNTSRITSDSVGRGWSVPINGIPAPALATLNEQAAKLGYVQVGQEWGDALRPPDLRVPADGAQPEGRRGQGAAPGTPAGWSLLGERLRRGLRRAGADFVRQWKPYSAETFAVVSAAADPEASIWWLVNLDAGQISAADGAAADQARWRVVAPAAAWEEVLTAGLNLGIAFRNRGMRYRDNGDGGAGSMPAETRVAMLAELLGITSWEAAAIRSLAAAEPSGATGG